LINNKESLWLLLLLMSVLLQLWLLLVPIVAVSVGESKTRNDRKVGGRKEEG
jgi:hypothetical protein